MEFPTPGGVDNVLHVTRGHFLVPSPHLEGGSVTGIIKIHILIYFETLLKWVPLPFMVVFTSSYSQHQRPSDVAIVITNANRPEQRKATIAFTYHTECYLQAFNRKPLKPLF